jgi:hypothetical protein
MKFRYVLFYAFFLNRKEIYAIDALTISDRLYVAYIFLGLSSRSDKVFKKLLGDRESKPEGKVKK